MLLQSEGFLDLYVRAKSPRPVEIGAWIDSPVSFLQSCAIAVYFWSSNIRSVCLNRIAAAV